MATSSKTTYTHTCDLCGAGQPRSDLRRFGLVAITEGSITAAELRIEGPAGGLGPGGQAG